MAQLFDPLVLRGVTFRNRLGMAPMCMYSCTAHDGIPDSWHYVHYGTRAQSGCGLIITEATAVDPLGRISLGDTGIWNENQVKAWQPITRMIRELGAVPVIQLAHAGRKAATHIPWEGKGPLTENEGAWTPVGPSPQSWTDEYATPHVLTQADLLAAVTNWESAARRSLAAGFQAVELHMAHGYLLHQFLSPLTNQRTDMYGGTFEGRTRFPLMVAQAVRLAWPDELPVFVRISCTDWATGGWSPDDSVDFCRQLKDTGIDLVDCSTGGAVPNAQLTPVASDQKSGYQVSFANRIKSEAKMPTAAVGLITDPGYANTVITGERADLVLLGRELLRNPYWPISAAQKLTAGVEPPRQYQRAIM